MQTSESINEVAKAMALAQGSIRPASKSSVNPHLKSKYADIASVWDAIREPLSTNGLAALQDLTADEFGVSVKTRIVHSSGQWMEFGPLAIPMTKRDPQGFGSACTYAKRYALCAVLGIVSGDEDDDGDKCTRDYQESSPKQSKTYSREPSKPLDDIETVSVEQAIKLADLVGDDKELRDKIFNGYSLSERYKSRGKIVKDYIDLPKNNFESILFRIETERGQKCSKT
jgi:hypothetical protein